MPKNYYLPNDDAGRAALLEHLAAHLPALANTLELGESHIKQLEADAASFSYTLSSLESVQATAKRWTAYKNLQRDGGEGTAAYPHVANLPPAAPAVPHGIIPRLTSLVARIKAAKNYSDDIGRELNFIGAAQIVDTDSAKPILDISKKAGQPSIQWPKGDADAIEIWVDRSDEKGFGFLTIANSTRVPDNAPLPATPVTWQYKAIYRVKDNRVGEWSDVVSITAGG